jgi:P pilus assembly chaperone PapD
VLASELAAATESGGVTIGGTRLIFDGGKKRPL